MASFFDTWAQADRDLSRGAEAPTSKEAYKRLKPHLADQQAQVLAWLREKGAEGGTSKEWARHVGKPLNSVSGRFSELHEQGLIRKSGRRREESMVWIAAEVMS